MALGPADLATQRLVARAIEDHRPTGRRIRTLLEADRVALRPDQLAQDRRNIKPLFADCWSPPEQPARGFEDWAYPDVFTL